MAHVGGSGGGSVCGSSSSATAGDAGGPVRHKQSRRGKNKQNSGVRQDRRRREHDGGE